MDSFVSATRGQERRNDKAPVRATDASIIAPSEAAALAQDSLLDKIPDPAESGQIDAWEQLKSPAAVVDTPEASASPSSAAPVAASASRVSEDLRAKLVDAKDTLVHKMEEFSSHHKLHQKVSDIPSQHTAVIEDVQKSQAREAERARDEDREFEATIV